MPTTVSELLKSQDLLLSGKVKWGESFQSSRHGIYIVSYSKDESSLGELIQTPPISKESVEFWLKKVTTFELDKMKNPETDSIIDRLSKFWLRDESILYIGMTNSTLSIRVSQYYNTELGERRPHAGGHWLKTLSNLFDLYVFYSECNFPEDVEIKLLDYFGNNVSQESISLLYDSRIVLPFANLQHPSKGRKKHGIGKAKLKG